MHSIALPCPALPFRKYLPFYATDTGNLGVTCMAALRYAQLCLSTHCIDLIKNSFDLGLHCTALRRIAVRSIALHDMAELQISLTLGWLTWQHLAPLCTASLRNAKHCFVKLRADMKPPHRLLGLHCIAKHRIAPPNAATQYSAPHNDVSEIPCDLGVLHMTTLRNAMQNTALPS
jgi:hypothetical protein